MEKKQKIFRRGHALADSRNLRPKRKKEAEADGPRPVTLELRPNVAGLLGLVGNPEPEPFQPDPFQLLAVESVAAHDTIVSAPTGSGKTWIAKKAIERELSMGRKAWYASPLKALSNSKFLEFGRDFGADNVGLLTGDHKINLYAPIIVGTTEILRNQLYDSMVGLTDIDCHLVVLDEAHYLGDLERGMVWEEVLIYMPARVRFLLLSATIDNAHQLADWLAHLREVEVKVVTSDERPVPLEPLVLNYEALHTLKLFNRENKLKKNKNKRDNYKHGVGASHFPREAHGQPGLCLPHLQKYGLLPSIFFLKSRKNCDEASIFASRLDEPEEIAQARAEFVDSFVSEHPSLANYRPVGSVLSKGVASHHAGHLPQFKMLVEELMSRNLLWAIFATSTVAAGVNFPARSVIIPNSDRFNGEDFVNLTATELLQMTGRAGRRGKDNIGFAIFVPGGFMNVQLMEHLFNSPPDPVKSSLKINFTMVLNLLNAFEPKEIKELLTKSLASWQIAAKPRKTDLANASKYIWEEFKRHQKFLTHIGLVDKNNHLTKDGLIATGLRLEHPLLIYAAIKANALPYEPARLAAILASMTENKKRAGYGFRPKTRLSGSLSGDLKAFSMAIQPMNDELCKSNFPFLETIVKESAKAIHNWASGGTWADTVGLYGRDQGDMIRLVSLVSERLNQLANLKEPETTAEVARKARKLIYRDPVI
jgi:superfamily II RNA helicase